MYNVRVVASGLRAGAGLELSSTLPLQFIQAALDQQAICSRFLVRTKLTGLALALRLRAGVNCDGGRSTACKSHQYCSAVSEALRL